MRRRAPLLCLAAAIALLAASCAFDAPWSWLPLGGAACAVIGSMERMMAEYERRARMPRGRKQK